MYDFSIYSILSLVVSEVYLLISVYILSKNPRSSVNRMFLLVGVSMAVWGLGEGMQRASPDAVTAFLWGNYVTVLGSSFHSVFLLHFWIVFSGKIESFSKKVIAALYLPGVVFLLVRLVDPGILIKGMSLEYWGYSTEGTPLYIIYMLYVMAYALAVALLALRASRKTYGSLKRQTRNIAVGILLVILIGVATQITRPLFHLGVPELTVTSTIIFISMIAYAVARYNLLTITPKLIAEEVIATMGDYVIAVDRNMRIALVNNSTLREFGYERGDLMGKSLDAVISDKTLSSGYDELLRNSPLSGRDTFLKKNGGGKVPVSANLSVLREGKRYAYGFVFVLRDMRKMNEMISSLRRKTEELSVSKKKAEDSHRELARRNVELERINKLAVGRELKMVELKKRLEKLEGSTGK